MTKVERHVYFRLGKKVVAFFSAIFGIWLLFIRTLKTIRSLWFYRRQIIEQCFFFSAQTLPIALVIAVFIGLGATILGSYQSSDLIPREVTINVIFKTIILALGPIVLSLVLAGKLGASLAAEIGSMKISEQIEALETMSLDPIGFLVMPRLVAGLIMLPVLTTFSNIISLFSAFFSTTVLSNWVTPQNFISGMQMDFLTFEFILGNLTKPAVYGVVITLISSYFGLNTEGGARGVGKAATNSVVVSAIIIVILDYYLGQLFLAI